MKLRLKLWLSILTIGASVTLVAGPASAQQIEGQVLGAGAPIANATITLFAATSDAPVQLSQSQSGPDGHFTLPPTHVPRGEIILYLVATGGEPHANGGSGNNPSITLLAVLGPTPPKKVIINEMTTIASVWTHAQFLNGTTIKGNALGLQIAAANVPNFVDLTTGGYGGAIQDAINSTQTPTMAMFATLANVMAGCVARMKTDACAQLFAAATGRRGKAPTDTLGAAESIARDMAYKPERVFALLDEFYPVPTGKTLRLTPFMPYLSFAPSAWVLPLKFTGGGQRAGQDHVR